MDRIMVAVIVGGVLRRRLALQTPAQERGDLVFYLKADKCLGSGFWIEETTAEPAIDGTFQDPPRSGPSTVGKKCESQLAFPRVEMLSFDGAETVQK
jgi:hypothetical protein